MSAVSVRAPELIPRLSGTAFRHSRLGRGRGAGRERGAVLSPRGRPRPSGGSMAAGVELGFAVAVESEGAWRLRSAYFPSKVGGRPAWLGEAGLPGPAALRCGRCQQPRAFLLQLYAPLPDRPDAFHRTLFVFACRGAGCYRLPGPRGPLCVFRNQLPRRNDTYSEEPPPEGPPPDPAAASAPPRRLRSGAALCRVCGCMGPHACGRCRRATYCGPEHQALDWRRGHRRSCGQSATEGDTADAVLEHNDFLFPEYEILIEPEEPDTPVDSSVDPPDEQGAVDPFVPSKDPKEKEELRATGSAGEAFQSLDEETLEAMAKHETKDDKIFQMFKEQIAAEPEQIIRYCRGGKGPVWVSGGNIPEEKDIPNCLCGAKRIFEFQIMPQLLNHLKVDSLGDSIDWGTLVVYTCADNCGEGNEYLEEFIWKQDFSPGSV